MKRIWLILSLFIFTMEAFSQVKVVVNPRKPVKEESFRVTFEITTTTDSEPRVSFYPIGLEVLGRNREVSVSSSYINGRFESNKKIRFVYEMISDQARIAKLKDIEVVIDNKKISHPPIRIEVLTRKKTPSPIFLRAEVSKDNIYVGEGVDLGYYLYTRVQVVNTEYKNFPKLNGFIKRFHKVNDEERTVEEGGVVYKKILKYSGRIYPEKSGNLYIDPLKLNIQYATNSGSPFGNFGLSFNRFRSKTIISKKVKIIVNSLPAENVPPNFTGLIGEHKFQFSNIKNKFVVNEAIEAKLEVVGPGALEKMEAPKVYDSPALEAFDTKSEFFEVGRSSGRKVFDYTFLARGNLTIPKKELILSYFEPETKKYIEVNVPIPELIISGGGGPSTMKSVPRNEARTSSTVLGGKKALKIKEPVAPMFTPNMNGIPLNWQSLMLRVLGLIVILQAIYLIVMSFLGGKSDAGIDELIKNLKKKGMNYSSFVSLVYKIPHEDREMTAKEVILASRLGKLDKKYFTETLEALELQNFSEDGNTKRRVKFKSSSFNSLKKEIKNAGH